MPTEDERLAELLQLVRDLCIGIAAFFAPPTGQTVLSLSKAGAPTDEAERVLALADRCRSHPAARGHDLFWNAEVTQAGDATWGSDHEPLACVALPLWSEDRWLGVFGAVDIVVPELDEEQRSGLEGLARALAMRAANTSAVVALPGAVTAPEAVTALPNWATALVPGATPLLSEVAERLPDGLVITGLDGTVLYLNGRLAEMSGSEAQDVVGADVGTLFPGQTRAEHPGFLVGTPPPGRRLRLTPESKGAPVDVCGALTPLEGIGECYVAVVREACRPPSGAVEKPSVEAPMRTVLDALDFGIVVCDADGIVTIANRAANELQGLSADDDIVGLPLSLTTRLSASDGTPLPVARHPLNRAVRGTIVQNERLVLGATGTPRRHILASAQPLLVPEFAGALLVLRDITAELEEQARLTRLALHDPLTGLANRNLLLDHLRRILGDFRTRGGTVALVFLDLDDFKEINDRYGHVVGDEVLMAVGRRVQGAVRSSDVVARLGGDEFVVAHATSDGPREIEQIVDRIRKTLSAPYQVRGQGIVVNASIGSVSADPRHEDPVKLLVRADREMYRRKRRRNVQGP